MFAEVDQLKQSHRIRPIHVFVLSNVIRRPIIVVSQHAPDADTDSHSLCGVYLPVLHAPSDCCRSPLVVVHVGHQFVPLVPRAVGPASPVHAGGLQSELGVPLWRVDAAEPLLVRGLLDSESAERALTTYLRVVELPYTSATSTGLFPVAKYDVIAPDINIVHDILTPAPSAEPALLAVRIHVDVTRVVYLILLCWIPLPRCCLQLTPALLFATDCRPVQGGVRSACGW